MTWSGFGFVMLRDSHAENMTDSEMEIKYTLRKPGRKHDRLWNGNKIYYEKIRQKTWQNQEVKTYTLRKPARKHDTLWKGTNIFWDNQVENMTYSNMLEIVSVVNISFQNMPWFYHYFDNILTSIIMKILYFILAVGSCI